MTALGKLFRTTAFKLSVIYLAVFSAFAVFLIVYIAHNTTQVLTRQITNCSAESSCSPFLSKSLMIMDFNGFWQNDSSVNR